MLETTGLLGPQGSHAIKLLQSLYLNNVSWDGSETGCGKTYVAAFIAKILNKPVVVIAPRLVIPIWVEILALFGVKPALTINYEKLVRGNTQYLKYNACNRCERFDNAVINLPSNSFIIFDESHKCKAPDSLTCGLLMAMAKQKYMVHLLSATQATTVLEMRAFGKAVHLHDGSPKGYRNFCTEFGAEEVGIFGKVKFNLDDPAAMEKMRRCHTNIFDFQKVGSRLTREMMGNLFPENQILAQSYDMGPNSEKIQEAYESMEDELAKLEEKTQDYADNHLAVIIKWRRIIEMCKVPSLVEMAEDLYDEGMSPVIFVNFTDTIETLGEKFESNPRFAGKNLIGYIYGGKSVKDRLQTIQDFNADKKRIIVGNMACASNSISLHDLNGKFPRVSLINPSYSAFQLLQALGRIHRQGGLTRCLQRIIFAANTIEEKACRRVQARLNNLSMLNDGDLVDGMKFFRFFMGKSI